MGQQKIVGEKNPQKTDFTNLKLGLKNICRNILVLVLFLIFWQILSIVTGSIFRFVPKPLEVLNAIKYLIFQGDLEGYKLISDHVYWSTLRILTGFILASITGIPLGFVTGLSPSFYRTFKVIIEPIRFIPPIAWIPLAIVLLLGFSRYTFLIWLGIFFPIWTNTMASIPTVNPIYINVAKVNGANRSKIIRKVIWPSVLPGILTGMRIGLGVGWMAIVAAEMVGGEARGIGHLILKYAELFKFAEVGAGMITVGIVGYLMNEIILRIEKKIFKWRLEVSL